MVARRYRAQDPGKPASSRKPSGGAAQIAGQIHAGVVRGSRATSGPPGRRAERGWHGVADGGTAFVCCWRSLRRAVPCMRMRPLGATGPSPDRGLRVCWGRVGRTRDGTSSGVQEPGLGAEHGGGILARAQLYWQDGTSKLGRGDLINRRGRTLGGPGGGSHSAELHPSHSRRSPTFLATSAFRPRDDKLNVAGLS